MNINGHQKTQLRRATATRVCIWIFVSIAAMLLLLALAMLVAPRLIDFASIKQQVQAEVAERTGGEFDYQEIGFNSLPRPSIELRRVSVSIPDLAEGSVAALRISPQFLQLLSGNLRLARIELDNPRLRLNLPDRTSQGTAGQPSQVAGLDKRPALAVAPYARIIAGLEVEVNNGRLAIVQNKHHLAEIEGLTLHSGVTTTDAASAQAALKVHVSDLHISRNDNKVTIKDLNLSGNLQVTGDKMIAKIEHLAVRQPQLALTGELSLEPNTPAIAINITGTGIDVDATRNAALSLAGEFTPIKEIFDFLRGGTVPRISYAEKGENASQLGDMNNIVITGNLQGGKISIPALKIDLSEVSGDVAITKGLLQGSGLSARLGKSTGQEGSLAISLMKESDLFTLDLMLTADLDESQSLLKRLIPLPAFTTELEKITNLHGTAHGKLTLGDSLSDINTNIAVNELSLTADYQRLPLPFTLSKGQVTFGNDRLNLAMLSGSMGHSQFTDLSSQLLFDNDLFLDISSGRFELDMAELYPWLAVQEQLREKLHTVKQVTGQVTLSALDLKGRVGKPAEWQFNSAGSMHDLVVESEFFPGVIRITGGKFAVDRQQLTFENLKTTGQDAELVLSGKLKGFSQQPVPPGQKFQTSRQDAELSFFNGIELGLDGSMGPKSVEWLFKKLKVPTSYAIHAPLSIRNAQVFWQPDATAAFKGLVEIDKGPTLTVDVDLQPDEFQVRQLQIKDQYSDATMVFNLKKDQHDFRFAGTLHHESLQALFVDGPFASGLVAGNFSLTIPQVTPDRVTATGRLTGENLPIPLSPGDTVDIAQFTLQADGPQLNVDISKLQRKDLTFEPVGGTVSFDRDRTDVNLDRAELCGITSRGLISFAGKEISLGMTLAGKDLDVATSYTCLTKGRVKATGRLDFSSKVSAKGKMNELVNGLQGPLQLTLSNGFIEKDKVLSRILEVLNVTEIVKGRLPDLGTTGLAYTTITVTGRFQDGKLLIDRFVMDGETLGLLGSGELRLEDEALDIELMAAPFKTVDTVVKHIPGVNYLLADSLIAIPVSITGTLNDPKVTVLSPSAIGSSLYNLVKRTITSPFKLIEKINPWGK